MKSVVVFTSVHRNTKYNFSISDYNMQTKNKELFKNCENDSTKSQFTYIQKVWKSRLNAFYQSVIALSHSRNTQIKCK